MIALKKASVHSVGVFVSHLECIYNREQDRENKFVKYTYYRPMLSDKLTFWHFLYFVQNLSDTKHKYWFRSIVSTCLKCLSNAQ